MRVVVVDTYYPPFLRAHYRERRGLDASSFAEQHSSLMERRFGTSDAYSHAFAGLGHDAFELIANCVPLQAAWLREHDRTRDARILAAVPRSDRLGRLLGRVSGLMHRVLLAQLDELDPDVVYLQDIRFHTPTQVRELRGSRRLVVGQTASRAPSPDHLAELDLVLTSFPHYVRRFREAGARAAYLRLGFDERVLDGLRPVRDVAPLVFVGGLDRRVHPEGVRLLEQVCAALPDSTSVYGYGVDSLPRDSRIRGCYRGEAWGTEMYDVLAGGRLALNRHIAAAEGHANNMRLFEASGVGTAVLTEAAPNLPDLFEAGVEVAVYETGEDVASLAARLLADEQRLAGIAAAGQRRTLGEHTLAARVRELVPLIEDLLRQGQSRRSSSNSSTKSRMPRT